MSPASYKVKVSEVISHGNHIGKEFCKGIRFSCGTFYQAYYLVFPFILFKVISLRLLDFLGRKVETPQSRGKGLDIYYWQEADAWKLSINVSKFADPPLSDLWSQMFSDNPPPAN